MYINNELGTENPITQISDISNRNGIVFHTDAVQYVGKKPLDLNSTNIDMLSLSAHKFYGPKGVGALYVKDGINLTPIIYGGGQEKNLSPGTENLVAIHGMAIALKKSVKEMKSWNKKLIDFEKAFVKQLNNYNINFTINGKNRTPGILSITFHDILSQDMVIALDIKGYAISGGSACSSGVSEPSKILKEIDMDDKSALETVRISFGKNIQKKHLTGLSKSINDVINESR